MRGEGLEIPILDAEKNQGNHHDDDPEPNQKVSIERGEPMTPSP